MARLAAARISGKSIPAEIQDQEGTAEAPAPTGFTTSGRASAAQLG